MKITYAEIERAASIQLNGIYTMSLPAQAGGRAIEHAVNQGIDPHLEACFVPARGDKYEWKKGRLECEVSAKSLPVLLRRLQEMADAQETKCEDEMLHSDMLESLGLNPDATIESA